ncbi:MAG: helix-turn-helix domain-containing protein [Candidatus Thermoplasmatota archaeon]
MRLMARRRAATLKERILLHLLDNLRFAEGAEFPTRLTQRGIASHLATPRSHAAIALGSLIEEGLVDYRKVRVRGERRRMKGYFLTPEGINDARRLSEHFLTQKVKSAGGTSSLGDIFSISPGASLAQILGSVDQDWVLEKGYGDLQPADNSEAEAVGMDTQHTHQHWTEALQGAEGVVCPVCGTSLSSAGSQYFSYSRRIETLGCARCGLEIVIHSEPHEVPVPDSALPSHDAKGRVALPLLTGLILFLAPLIALLLMNDASVGRFFCLAIPWTQILGGLLIALGMLRARPYPGMVEWGTLLCGAAGLFGIGFSLGARAGAIGLSEMLSLIALLIVFSITLLFTLRDPKFHGLLLSHISGAIIPLSIVFGAVHGTPLSIHPITAALLGMVGISYAIAGGLRAGFDRKAVGDLCLFLSGVGIVGLAVLLYSRDALSHVQSSAALAWITLGIALCAAGVLAERMKRLRDALWRALPFAAGVAFIGFGTIMLMMGLYLEGLIECLIGLPLSAYGLRESMPNLLPVSLGTAAYVLSLEMLTYAAIFW